MALVCARLRKEFSLEDDDAYVKTTSAGGADVHLSPHARRLFPAAIEVKAQEALNIWSALEQSKNNCTAGCLPIVFFKKSHSPMFVACDIDTFFALVKGHHDRQGRATTTAAARPFPIKVRPR